MSWFAGIAYIHDWLRQGPGFREPTGHRTCLLIDDEGGRERERDGERGLVRRRARTEMAEVYRTLERKWDAELRLCGVLIRISPMRWASPLFLYILLASVTLQGRCASVEACYNNRVHDGVHLLLECYFVSRLANITFIYSPPLIGIAVQVLAFFSSFIF